MLFCIIAKSKGQTLIINDTSVVHSQIKAFLIKDFKDTVGIKIALIRQENLLDSTNNNFGVFTFRELSSESTPYLYLRNYGETKITVILKYHVDTVMRYLSVFFDINQKYITYSQRIACMKKVLEILEAKLD